MTFILHKSESLLKQQPDEKVVRQIQIYTIGDDDAYFDQYQKYLDSLVYHKIEPSDWEGIGDGVTVPDHAFVLQHQIHLFYGEWAWQDCDKRDYDTEPEIERRIIARPKPQPSVQKPAEQKLYTEQDIRDVAIKFSEWKEKNNWWADEYYPDGETPRKQMIWSSTYPNQELTTEQLYDVFIQNLKTK